MIPNQRIARKFLDGFKKSCPPCMIFYGPQGCGQVELFHEYFDCRVSDSDLRKFSKPKVDEFSDLKVWLSHKPEKDFRIVLIDHVDDISKEAQNFLLKAIEDSATYVRWVLISETKQLLSPLKSRSFLIPFRPFQPEHGVSEDFNGSLKLQKQLSLVDAEEVLDRVVKVVESGRYCEAYKFCQWLKDITDKKENELELLRDIYLYCCNVIYGYYANNKEALNVIQETKNKLSKNLRGEHTFKTLFLRIL